jgi:iron complex outermembrane recepter protein
MRKSGLAALNNARRFAFGTSVIALGIALAATQAIAQESKKTTSTDTVIVTGIRKGIQDAISAKRRATSIIEAVSAEDIGKLPDNSIAESIARLPGLAAQRTNGRAQTLSVRGLGPDFTVTTLNGREQASVNDNRGVEFDQYPSELVSQVRIFKTPDASMTYQGIAGTADISTVRPLAFSKRVVALNYRHEQNSQDAYIGGTTNSGDRFSGTYINQNKDRSLGWALGYAYNKTPYQAQRSESWGYPTCDSRCLPADAGKLITGGEKDAVQSASYERKGYMGVLEWKPNDKGRVTIDAYHSDFEELQRIARLEWGLAWSGATLQPGYKSDANKITSGTFTGVNTVIENYVNNREATLDAIGINGEYKVDDNWTLGADLSYSKSSRTDLILETTAGSGSSETVNFSTNNIGITSTSTPGSVNYSNFAVVGLNDPGGWGCGPCAAAGTYRAGYLKNPTVNDELNAIKLSASRALETKIFNKMTFGLNYAERTKSKVGEEGFLGISSAKVLVPAQYQTGTTDTSFFGVPTGMISYDALGLYRDGVYKYYSNLSYPNAQRGWTINENLTTFYAKADIDSKFMGIPVTGNIGLQYVHAYQAAAVVSATGVGNGTNTANDSYKYSDVLPSMNLNFALPNEFNLRFAAAKTSARPRFDQISAGASYTPIANGGTPVTVNGTPLYWTGNGGTAKVKPWTANAYDISLERYFARKGYVSLAAYYKELTSYIYPRAFLFDFAGQFVPQDGGGSSYSNARANTMGIFTGLNNGSGGHIQGIEATASVPFELINPMLDGFGVILSGAFNESEVEPVEGVKIDVPGFSKKNINATVYYEKNGFSARVSQRYRGDFLGEVPAYDNTLTYVYVSNESITDAQIGYSFQDGKYKGLSINLSGSNLTNEPFFTYANKGHPENVIKYEKYGSTYTLSVGYKF